MTAPVDRPGDTGQDAGEWPFDADRNHRWSAQYRIPVVADPFPGWKYEVALVIGEQELMTMWTGIEPTEVEAAIVGSYIDYRRNYYNQRWQRQMLERPLDVDGTTNTVTLLKRPNGNWCYRRATWRSGPHLWPEPRAERQYPDLVELLDHINEYSDRWPTWKAEHPEVFAATQAAGR